MSTHSLQVNMLPFQRTVNVVVSAVGDQLGRCCGLAFHELVAVNDVDVEIVADGSEEGHLNVQSLLITHLRSIGTELEAVSVGWRE